MAGLMTAPMIVIEVVLMRAMYHSARLNFAIIIASLVALAAFFIFIRQQSAIGDEQFLRSMIPHHAGAILMCEKASIRDPEIRQLCASIISGQQSEIDQMKAISGYAFSLGRLPARPAEFRRARRHSSMASMALCKWLAQPSISFLLIIASAMSISCMALVFASPSGMAWMSACSAFIAVSLHLAWCASCATASPSGTLANAAGARAPMTILTNLRISLSPVPRF
jgi:Domain of unknown function (DUF305)